MSNYAKKIIYITQADYDTLYANGAKTGTITKNGTSYSYDDNADYRIKVSGTPLTTTNAYDTASANTQFWSKDNTGTVLYNANVATVNNVPTLTLKTKQKNASTGVVTDGADITFTDTDTHYTTKMFVGDTSNSKTNVAQADPNLKIFDSDTLESVVQLVQSGAVSINSDATGKITISSPIYPSIANTWLLDQTFNKAIVSAVTTQTGAPFVVNSTVKVTNLNADKVDGYDFTAQSIHDVLGYTPVKSNVESSTANYQNYLVQYGDYDEKTLNPWKRVTDIAPTPGVFRSNLGDPSLYELAFLDREFTNKTDFFPLANMLFERSTDGVTYTEDTTLTSAQKANLVGGDYGANLTTGINQYVRITFTQNGYVWLNALYLWHSMTADGDSLELKLEWYSTTGSCWYAYSFDNNNWTTVATDDGTTNFSSPLAHNWPGHTILSHAPLYFGTSDCTKVRITFKSVTTATTGSGYCINKLQWWGGYPDGNRNVYSTDAYKNVWFPASVYLTSGNALYVADSTGIKLNNDTVVIPKIDDSVANPSTSNTLKHVAVVSAAPTTYDPNTIYLVSNNSTPMTLEDAQTVTTTGTKTFLSHIIISDSSNPYFYLTDSTTSYNGSIQLYNDNAGYGERIGFGISSGSSVWANSFKVDTNGNCYAAKNFTFGTAGGPITLSLANGSSSTSLSTIAFGNYGMLDLSGTGDYLNLGANGYISSTSDRRLKKDIKPIGLQDIEDRMAKVETKKFKFKNGDDKTHIGIIAQQLIKNFPEYADQLTQKDASGYYSINTLNLIYVLWEATNQESKKRKELEDRVSKLEKALGLDK